MTPYLKTSESVSRNSVDCDFIPDLPSGALDHYRKQAKFEWKRLKLVFEDANLLKLKVRNTF